MLGAANPGTHKHVVHIWGHGVYKVQTCIGILYTWCPKSEVGDSWPRILYTGVGTIRALNFRCQDFVHGETWCVQKADHVPGFCTRGKLACTKFPLYFLMSQILYTPISGVYKNPSVFFISPKFVHATFSKVQKLELFGMLDFYKSDFCTRPKWPCTKFGA